MKAQIVLLTTLIIMLTACLPPQISEIDIQNTNVAIIGTGVVLTQTALPTMTPTITSMESAPTPLPPEPTAVVLSPGQEDLKTVIQTYFDIRYLTYNSLQLPDFGDVISNEPDGKAFLDAEMHNLAVWTQYARLNSLRYSYYKYSLTFQNITTDPITQLVTVNVIEGNEVIYEISERLDPESPIISHSAGIVHTITLRNEQGQWKIISDSYHNDAQVQYWQGGESTEERQKFIDGILSPKETYSSSQTLKVTVTPDLIQISHWKEYESALANKLLPALPREKVLCEWQPFSQTAQELFVWTMCTETTPLAEISIYFFRTVDIPAVIHLNADGSVQSIEIPEFGPNYYSDLNRLFPLAARNGLPDVKLMEEHLDWRRTHPEEPPLIVLSATPIP